MKVARLAVAHTILVLGAVAGCSDSHGRDDDAGLVGAEDAGPLLRDAAIVPLDSAIAPDSAPILDAGPRGTCDADDARAAICPELLCDGPPSWHWNGDDCFWIDCGACEGTDCAGATRSEAECMAAHATCEPSLCRSTGGTWMWWTEECTHYACGRPGPIDCLIGRPVCDCGPDAIFEEGSGCVPADCAIPPPATREEQCLATGGAWASLCCDTICGERCPAGCAADACDCGRGRVFELGRGCVASASCYERQAGETCSDGARCDEGLVCCDRCGGAGCAGQPTCIAPTCDADPHTDTCGNRDDVP